MRERTCLWVAVVAAMMCLASVANAGVMAISSIDAASGVTTSPAGIGDWVTGWSFAPTEDVKVTALGVLDYDNNGTLAHDTVVGIWRQSDGVEVIRADVAANGPLSGKFVWGTPASQVTLQANTNYVIAFRLYAGLGEQYTYGNSSVIMAPEITYIDSAGETAPEFVMPSSYPGNGYGFIGPNFEYEVVPEPATMSLISLGGLAILSRRRRK